MPFARLNNVIKIFVLLFLFFMLTSIAAAVKSSLSENFVGEINEQINSTNIDQIISKLR